MRVEVTFSMEPSDPEDRTGLSANEYETVMVSLMELGGYDIDIKLVSS